MRRNWHRAAPSARLKVREHGCFRQRVLVISESRTLLQTCAANGAPAWILSLSGKRPDGFPFLLARNFAFENTLISQSANFAAAPRALLVDWPFIEIVFLLFKKAPLRDRTDEVQFFADTGVNLRSTLSVWNNSAGYYYVPNNAINSHDADNI
jgi:hypothetical protein